MLCCRGSSSVQKIDHRRRQSVVKTSKTHSPAAGSCATSLFLPHFDVICDLLLTKQTQDYPASRVSFDLPRKILFPIFLGRPKKTLLAG